MSRRNKDARPDMPKALFVEEQDQEEAESGPAVSDPLPDVGRSEFISEESSKPLEEDDDNASQQSDEALPNDEAEAALARRPSREGSRFDEA
ncbi:MAG: hypothetical protein KL840_07970 [Aquamicrobium sp.]|nr:hypothetical protein [Aquamicrobium sp.]